jgi:hypothetical protein
MIPPTCQQAAWTTTGFDTACACLVLTAVCAVLTVVVLAQDLWQGMFWRLHVHGVLLLRKACSLPAQYLLIACSVSALACSVSAHALNKPAHDLGKPAWRHRGQC